MAKKSKKRAGKRKSKAGKRPKRVAAGRRNYKKGGLRAYSKSPKYAAKRRAAAKKAARTRARNKRKGYRS